MKIHIGIDPKSQQIIFSELTDNHGKDIDAAIDFIKLFPRHTRPYGRLYAY